MFYSIGLALLAGVLLCCALPDIFSEKHDVPEKTPVKNKPNAARELDQREGSAKSVAPKQSMDWEALSQKLVEIAERLEGNIQVARMHGEGLVEYTLYTWPKSKKLQDMKPAWHMREVLKSVPYLKLQERAQELNVSLRLHRGETSMVVNHGDHETVERAYAHIITVDADQPFAEGS